MNFLTTDRHRALIGLTIVAATSAIALPAAATSPPDTAPGTAPGEAVDAQIADTVQGILDRSLEPDAIDWACCGVDAPATGVSVAVRIPGHDDLVLAAGEHVDGTPFDPNGSFATGSLGTTLVETIAWQLADEGLLDLTATVDTWLPAQQNADRVTLQMLLDGTSGWDGWAGVDTPLIVADFERHWTLGEMLDTTADIAPLHDPGTFDNEGIDRGMAALAYVIEEVTGQSIAELIAERITEPLGLDDTFMQDGANQPARYQHGVFSFEGQRVDTSMYPNVSYYTYYGPIRAAVSNTTDLLDLLDAFDTGELFTAERVPGPEHFLGARIFDGSVHGYGLPFNGYCPCESAGAGNGLDVATIGRQPSSVGQSLFMLRYPDGVSIVLHFNSGDEADRDDTRAVVEAIHAAVVAQ